MTDETRPRYPWNARPAGGEAPVEVPPDRVVYVADSADDAIERASHGALDGQQPFVSEVTSIESIEGAERMVPPEGDTRP